MPRPSPAAVMFCVSDVSGSMTQDIKDTAKRFFFLLYLLLKKTTNILKWCSFVTIRKHRRWMKKTFFYARETDGVSSALNLMGDILMNAIPQWVEYLCRTGIGCDNWHEDNERCRVALTNQILPFVQYYIYIEIGDRDCKYLWYFVRTLAKWFPMTALPSSGCVNWCRNLSGVPRTAFSINDAGEVDWLPKLTCLSRKNTFRPAPGMDFWDYWDL